jgi:hypothetical protein
MPASLPLRSLDAVFDSSAPSFSMLSMKSVFLPSPQVENSFATLSTEGISPSPTRSGPLFTQVMKGKRRPMRVPAIIAAGVPLATSLKGKTPAQTFYSVLYSESKKADGLVVQTGKGEFRLKPEARNAKARARPVPSYKVTVG